MKWKLNVFTIFIILLVILVLFMMINKWFTIKETKETFVDFYKSNAENSLTILYIPQYSSDTKRLVSHLYDNLYFDDKNGAVIEVEGTQSTSAEDTTGSTIQSIHISPRNGGLTLQKYETIKKTDGTVQPYDTVESKITTLTPAYDQYTTIGKTAIANTAPAPLHMYQFFYYTWNKQSFIHLFKFNTSDAGSVKAKQLIFLRTFVFGENGWKSVFEDASKITGAIPIPSDNGTPRDNYDNSNNKKVISSPTPPITSPLTTLTPQNSYLDNSIKVFQITPYVFYDTARGIIIINTPSSASPTFPILTCFDNAGNTATPSLASKPIEIASGMYKIFAKSSPSGMVLVTSYSYNTIITVIAYTKEETINKIVSTQRFNNKENKIVNDLATDPDYVAATSAPTTAPATTPPGGWDEYNNDFNRRWDEYMNNDGRMNCGSDRNCWYWFFKSLPSFNDQNDTSDIYDNNGASTISDDYFLKTEVVPPVCPQCPNCPDSGCGTCTSCGGNGGSGTNTFSNINLKLTQASPGKYKDDLGNIYIAYSDSSGNTKFVLQGTGAGALTGTGTGAIGETAAGVNNLGDNTAGVANNLINTAGGVVGTAGNLAYSAGSGAVNLLKDTGSGAVDLLKDTGSGAVDLLKGVGSGIANLGSGGLQMQQGSQYNSTTGLGGSGRGSGASLATTSDKTFGKMPGQTPVDNYSYYGALQSKGGNFMPVTADFSSFRK